MKKPGKVKIISKKEYTIVLALVLLAVVALLVTLSLIIYSMISKDGGLQAATVTYDKHFMIVADDVDSDFTNRIYEAAKKEGEERGVYVELVGANMTDSFTLQDRIKIAIAAKPDGIMVESDNTTEINDLIGEAVEEGIPVVTYLNDGAYSKRQSYVGNNYYKLGMLYADEILKNNNSRHVSILLLTKNTMPDSSREGLSSGIVDEFQKQDKKIVVSVDVETVDTSSALDVQESVHSLLSDDRREKNIICMDEKITQYVYQDMVDYNRVGEMNVYGFGVSSNILESIKSGVVESTASVDVDTMGSTCVNALCEYFKAGYISNYIYVDTEIVNRDNVDEVEELLKDDE